MKAQLAVAVLSLAAAAHAGYAELSAEVDAYAPPAHFFHGVPASVAAAPDDAEFAAQVEALRQARARWEASLGEPSPKDFYRPDAALAATVKTTDPAALLADGFGLEVLEALAFARNPAILTRERELRAVLQGYSQIENLDTILRRYATLTSGLMPGGGEAPPLFPFPGVLALKGQIVNQDALALREELEIARRDAVTAARKIYWELLYLDEAREVVAHTLDLTEGLRRAASARYEAGETSFQDVVRVGVEREKLREESRTLDEERRNMEAMLRETLNLSPSTLVGRPGLREPDDAAVAEEPLFALARERRQELTRMKAMIGKMERMLEMTESMVYPGFSLGLSTFRRTELSRGGGAGMGGDEGAFPTTTPASMGEGVPRMPWFGRDDAYLEELRQRIEALRRDLDMTEAATLLQVHQAWFALDKARREKTLYADKVVTLSQAAFDASARGYAAGKVMFADLIEASSGLLADRLAARRAWADTGIARAELEAAVGAALPTSPSR